MNLLMRLQTDRSGVVETTPGEIIGRLEKLYEERREAAEGANCECAMLMIR